MSDELRRLPVSATAALPLTSEAINQRHCRIETAPGWFRCSWDREVWPCDAIRLLDERDDLRAALDRLPEDRP